MSCFGDHSQTADRDGLHVGHQRAPLNKTVRTQALHSAGLFPTPPRLSNLSGLYPGCRCKGEAGKDYRMTHLPHAYRSFLDDVGAPVGVQQKLMRHAQVSTTMNTYGNALMESKRTANTKIVQMVLPSKERLAAAG